MLVYQPAVAFEAGFLPQSHCLDRSHWRNLQADEKTRFSREGPRWNWEVHSTNTLSLRVTLEKTKGQCAGTCHWYHHWGARHWQISWIQRPAWSSEYDITVCPVSKMPVLWCHRILGSRELEAAAFGQQSNFKSTLCNIAKTYFKI